jgi:hypothetical protein
MKLGARARQLRMVGGASLGSRELADVMQVSESEASSLLEDQLSQTIYR